MKLRTLLKTFAKNEDGGPATEAALLLALVAAIAGFGMIFLGEALSEFFTDAGESFSPGAQWPVQPPGCCDPPVGVDPILPPPDLDPA